MGFSIQQEPFILLGKEKQMINMYFLADSLVMRFVKDHFDEYRESTIGGKYQR